MWVYIWGFNISIEVLVVKETPTRVYRRLVALGFPPLPPPPPRW